MVWREKPTHAHTFGGNHCIRTHGALLCIGIHRHWLLGRTNNTMTMTMNRRFHTTATGILVSLVVVLYFQHSLCHGYVCVTMQGTRSANFPSCLNLSRLRMMAEPPPTTYSHLEIITTNGDKPEAREEKLDRISVRNRMSNIARNMWRRFPSLRRNKVSQPTTILQNQNGLLVDKEEIVGVAPTPPSVNEVIHYRRQSRAAQRSE